MNQNLPLTETQLQIVNSPLERLVVEAQPGSGKTRVLVEKLVRTFSHVRPDQVVAITFTEKAAQEIKNRIAKLLPDLSLDQSWVSTIHGFCHRILKLHAWEAKLPSDFKVLPAEQALFLREQAVQRTLDDCLLSHDRSMEVVLSEYGFARTRTILNQLSLLRVLPPTRFPLFSQSCEKGNAFGSASPAAELVDPKSAFVWEHIHNIHVKCAQKYAQEKEARHSLDFDDLMTLCLRLFEQNPQILKRYRAHFKWLFVDEFQDTNHQQTQLVRLLTEGLKPCPKLMIVGDPKQSIYRFRGADVDLFYEVKNDILEKQGFCFELLENFRSHPKLTEFVNILFKPLLGSQFLASIPIAAEKSTKSKATVEYWKPDPSENKMSRELEAAYCAKHIKKLSQSQSIILSNMAILFRAMTYVDLFEDALTKAGIPWVRTDLGHFFDNSQIQELLSGLRFVLNPSDDMALWTILSSPEIGISQKGLLSISTHHIHNGPSLYESMRQYTNILSLSKIDQLTIKEMVLMIAKLKHLVGRISLMEWFQHWKVSPTREVRHFLNIVRDFECENPDMEWKGFLNYCESLKAHKINIAGDPTEVSDDGVRLLTVHQSKGLEFDAVYLPDLSYTPRREYPYVLVDRDLGMGLKTFEKPNQWVEDETYGRIKEKEKANDEQESKRLLYVAMTRAKTHLILSHTSSKPRRSSWGFWLEEYFNNLEPLIDERQF